MLAFYSEEEQAHEMETIHFLNKYTFEPSSFYPSILDKKSNQ